MTSNLGRFKRQRLDANSIDRALDNAKRQGWVERWQRHPEGGYVVHIRRWGPERFRTLREGYAFALGLAAASRNHSCEEEKGKDDK